MTRELQAGGECFGDLVQYFLSGGLRNGDNGDEATVTLSPS